MKPLTIEELKALKVYDWVWIKWLDIPEDTQIGYYQKKLPLNENVVDDYFAIPFSIGLELAYKDYGIKWLAYKNKEQAEAIEDRFTRKDSTYYEKALVRLQELENKIEKGEILELPCIRVIERKAGRLYEVVYVQIGGMIGNETYPNKSEAERRLAEL